MEVGDPLPNVVKTMDQARIARYADASGDHNPLHVDAAFAAATQFGGVIAHGMLVLAFISEMLTQAFGLAWVEEGSLRVRLRGPARPGDVVTARGTVRRRTEEGGRAFWECAVESVNQKGEVLISGDARVPIREDQRA